MSSGNSICVIVRYRGMKVLSEDYLAACHGADARRYSVSKLRQRSCPAGLIVDAAPMCQIHNSEKRLW